ncbi:MAG: flagellar basal body-associated FliL family protein [Alphaproteobacteria bacterium]|nr:flagellar basal body-associated FliL family protein [Alphaproteobacteria bacterium]
MSDTDDDEDDIDEGPADDDGGDDEGEGGGRRKKGGRRRRIILIAAPLLVIVLVVAGLFFAGIGPFGGSDEEEAAAEESHGEGGAAGADGEHGEGASAGHVGFYELPQMTVNLNTTDGSTAFLRLTVALELSNDTPESRAQLDAMLPRVLDNFQVYMRELRLDDISGSAGLFRLKQELLTRVNRAVEPVKISDVLFSELLVQ